MVTLAFREVGQTFGDLTVFSRLSCTIAGGKVTAVTGGNGSGKSTFLRIAARLLCPTAGTVETREAGGAPFGVSVSAPSGHGDAGDEALSSAHGTGERSVLLGASGANPPRSGV